jgi:hypothetical protein
MYYMMMAKLSENDGVGIGGIGLFKVMRNNDIDFKGMHECGLEAYSVPDEIRLPGTMLLTPRVDPSYAPNVML